MPKLRSKLSPVLLHDLFTEDASAYSLVNNKYILLDGFWIFCELRSIFPSPTGVRKKCEQ